MKSPLTLHLLLLHHIPPPLSPPRPTRQSLFLPAHMMPVPLCHLVYPITVLFKVLHYKVKCLIFLFLFKGHGCKTSCTLFFFLTTSQDFDAQLSVIFYYYTLCLCKYDLGGEMKEHHPHLRHLRADTEQRKSHQNPTGRMDILIKPCHHIRKKSL